MFAHLASIILKSDNESCLKIKVNILEKEMLFLDENRKGIVINVMQYICDLIMPT
jgi:hypothetical protein